MKKIKVFINDKTVLLKKHGLADINLMALKKVCTNDNNIGETCIRIAKEYMLGSRHRYVNRQKTVEILKHAHELGNPKGSFYYALQLFEGSGVEEDTCYAAEIVTTVISVIEHNAAAKRPDYIVILADMYSFGLGKPRSFELAMEYYLIAADLGNLEAMCSLGYMYSIGQGTKNNLEKSFYYYKKSAELGYLHSMRDVGQCYYSGLGTHIDYKNAVRWFKKASKRNYSHATCDLALCYLKGHGVKKSLSRAAKTYLLAIKQDEQRTIRDIIAHSIDVKELLQNGKINFIHREKIDTIDYNVFANGTIIINAYIKFVEPSVFYNATDIVKFFVEKDNLYYMADHGVLYSKDGTILVRFPLGANVLEFVIPEHVRHIGAYAFQNCRYLQHVKLNDNIETIGERAFDGCKTMQEIQLPSSLRSIGA
jgi:TPR repeat protein